MDKPTKKSFREATKLPKIWNTIVKWNGYSLAIVMYHDLKWKLVDNNATFEDISNNSYKPIAQFYTQEELWQYIKINLLNK